VAAHKDQYHCDQCRFNRHCDEDFSWPGSRGPAGFVRFAIPGVIESKTCFLPMVTAASREWLRLHMDFKAGFLPFGGGTMEQPAAFREAMVLIESTLNEIHREEMKRGR
jgi:hypothetical protein